MDPLKLPLFRFNVIIDVIAEVFDGEGKSYSDDESVFILDWHQDGETVVFRTVCAIKKDDFGELKFKIESSKDHIIQTRKIDETEDPLEIVILCDGFEVYSSKAFKLFSMDLPKK